MSWGVLVFFLVSSCSKDLLNLDDLIVLRRYRANNRVLHPAARDTIEHIAQYAELGRQELACTAPPSFYEALQIVSTLQQGIDIGLYKCNVQLIVPEAPSYPHSAGML